MSFITVFLFIMLLVCEILLYTFLTELVGVVDITLFIFDSIQL